MKIIKVLHNSLGNIFLSILLVTCATLGLGCSIYQQKTRVLSEEDRFPLEIVAKICTYLPNADLMRHSLVSKKWQSAVLSSLKLKKIAREYSISIPSDISAIRESQFTEDQKIRLIGLCMEAAIKNNDVKTLGFLIKAKGGDPNGRNREGNSLLYYAAKENHMKVIRTLVACGANIDEQLSGETLLNCCMKAAIKNNDAETLGFLIKEKGGDPNGRDRSSDSLLYYAAEEGHTKIIPFLVACGANIDEQFREETLLSICMEAAVKNNDAETLEFLIKKSGDLKIIDRKGNYLLRCAAKEGYMNIIRILFVDHKADSNLMGTILDIAATYGHTDIVKFLLNHGATSQSNSPCIKIVKLLLLEDRCNIDDWLNAFLHSHTQPYYGPNKSLGITKLLLDCMAGSHLEKLQENDARLVKLMKLLIAPGADSNSKKEWKDEALCITKKKGEIGLFSFINEKL